MGLFSRHRSRNALPSAVAAAVPDRRRLFHRLPRKFQILLGLPIALGAATGAIFATLLIYYTIAFPDPLSLRHKERAPVIRILARDNSLINERGGADDYIPLDLIPPIVIDAVVATEDRRFNDHWGLDPVGLVRAALANLRAGRFAQGGSTLTQQLAKNLFLTSERTMGRKLEELVLAVWLEMRLGKRDILELYLNRVYFGGGAYGIEAASQRYFDKSARELSIAEAAVLAGLLKAPSKYSPSTNPEAARDRGRIVLTKMREFRVITPEQESQARAEEVRFVGAKQQQALAGIDYAVDYILERLPSIIGSDHFEVIVETTIDAALQVKASQALQKALILQGTSLAASQGAVTILDGDGRILALVGGRSYADSQFNRAIKAKRQPGSAFKPFVYLAALESGLTPESATYDLPLNLKGWSPKNDNGKYTGAVTLRHALAHSINTVAVRLLLDSGAHRVAKAARRLGIGSDLREDPSLALGTSEVSLLELTGAYTAFANGGYAVEPHIVRRVRLGSGRVLYARPAAKVHRNISLAHVSAMNSMLHSVMTDGTGRRAALTAHPAAGKTGTSQEFRDAWFVGYTAYMTAGVWIGNDNGQPMNKVRGGQLPAQVWRDVMQFAHQGMMPLALAGLATGPNLHEDEAATAIETSALGADSSEEVLPWLVPNAAPLAVAPPLAAALPEQPQPPATKAASHPKERISEDFIARALAADGAADGAAIPARPRVGVTEERDGRFIVRPPTGIMSLGAGSAASGGDGPPQTSFACGYLGLFC
jgi:penicillin-binding protein 1A